MNFRTICVIFSPTVSVCLLAACGGGSSPASSTGGGNTSAAPSNDGGRADLGGTGGGAATSTIGGASSSSGSSSVGAGGASASGAAGNGEATGGVDSGAAGNRASGGTTSVGEVAAGAGGASAGGSGSAGTGGSSAPFICTLLFGVSPTGQWFDGGFLPLVDGTRWESIWIAHHYTNFWADPNDSAWNQAFDPYPGPPHACARSSTTPDRVVFVAVNWAYTSAAQWEADLSKIVVNLQSKYPSVRRIELMTLTRAPGNVVCAPGGSSSETVIPAWTDVAIAATEAKYPGLVVQAPKFEVPSCADFMQGGLAPQYTDAGAADVARLFGAYYASHP